MTALAPQMEHGLVAGLARGRRRRVSILFGALGVLLVATLLASFAIGAAAVPVRQVARIFAGLATQQDASGIEGGLIVLHIRLPRALLALMIGACLAVCGTFLQGMFRNPLADPGLIGVSAGAALAAGATIVLGERLFDFTGRLPFAVLPAGAFLGGLLATLVLYGVATRSGRTSIATLLLAGVAVAAFAGAMMGLLAYVSDDRQLRDLTFWMLGSLGGASWAKVASLAPVTLAVLCALPFLGRGLNALTLGEAEAYHLGVPVERMKRLVIVLTALGVGASVASAGVIGFVGIVVPHVLRILAGADHRVLLPASALLGAIFLLAADTVARVAVAPSELPIGILTAMIGAPFFLWLLLRGRGLGA